MDHVRSVRPSSILNIYLLSTLLFDAARARTLWRMPENRTIASLFLAIVLWKIVLLLLEIKEKRGLLRPEYQHAPPEETGGIVNRSFFWWFNSLLLAGNKQELFVPDLFEIDSALSFHEMENDMRYRWMNSEFSIDTCLCGGY
jgi:ATP-binding cassette, subfamily C (CFTR/MRP), member 1